MISAISPGPLLHAETCSSKSSLLLYLSLFNFLWVLTGAARKLIAVPCLVRTMSLLKTQGSTEQQLEETRVPNSSHSISSRDACRDERPHVGSPEPAHGCSSCPLRGYLVYTHTQTVCVGAVHKPLIELVAVEQPHNMVLRAPWEVHPEKYTL